MAATNLNTGEKLLWHADDEFPSASVMKLPILVELERQIAAGQLSWTESLRAEVSAMIAISDNTAANEIADAIHPQSVNDSMNQIGLTGTHFVNLFNEDTNPGQNQTTPANMARLLELIANNQIVSAQVSGDIRGLLARNTDRSKLVRLLPADAQVAHKSGWFDGVANDVGIVTVDRGPDPLGDRRLHREHSRCRNRQPDRRGDLEGGLRRLGAFELVALLRVRGGDQGVRESLGPRAARFGYPLHLALDEHESPATDSRWTSPCSARNHCSGAQRFRYSSLGARASASRPSPGSSTRFGCVCTRYGNGSSRRSWLIQIGWRSSK